MRLIPLIAAIVVSACEPGVEVQFVVATAGDDSAVQHSTQIANTLAQRRGMSAGHLDSSCDLARYERDLGGGVTRILDFCVDHGAQRVSFVLEEFITSHWSAAGDSLRRELEDTLRTRFGDRVKKTH